MDKDLVKLRQSIKETQQDLDDYEVWHKCRQIEWFNRIRRIVENVMNEREMCFKFSEMFDILEISDLDLPIVYAFFSQCDKIYGKTAKFADLCEQDQEIVLSFSF